MPWCQASRLKFGIDTSVTFSKICWLNFFLLSKIYLTQFSPSIIITGKQRFLEANLPFYRLIPSIRQPICDDYKPRKTMFRIFSLSSLHGSRVDRWSHFQAVISESDVLINKKPEPSWLKNAEMDTWRWSACQLIVPIIQLFILPLVFHIWGRAPKR